MLGLAATMHPALAQNSNAPAEETTWLRHIAAEIARLRIDVIEHRIECGRDRLPKLENELRLARQEQQRLESEEQGNRREIAQINEMIGKSDDPNERAQMDSFRKDLETGVIESARAGRALLPASAKTRSPRRSASRSRDCRNSKKKPAG